MAAGYVNLPAAQIPRNAMLDFSPIQQGIESGRNWSQQQHNAMLREKADTRADADQAMQKTNFGNQQTTFQQGQEDREKTAWGRRAQAIDQIQDPQQRAAAWGQLLPRHPGFANLDPIYKDPMQGPKMVMSEAGLLPDPSKAEYGKTGAIMQGQDGRFYSVQFNANGTRKIEPLQAQGGTGLEPAKGVKWVDDGLTQTPMSNATGAPQQGAAPVQNRVADVEKAKLTGRNDAEIQINKPKVEATLNTLDRQTTLVNQNIDQVIAGANNWTAGPAGVVFGSVPGTPGYDLRQQLETIKANIGFDKLQSMRENSPTGGALGQVSNFENELLQAVEGSLQQGQSPAQLVANLNRVKMLRQKVLEERKQAFAKTYPPVQTNQGPQPKHMNAPLPPEGQTQIPPQAVRLLQGNPTPEVVQQFEAKYGPGSAAQFLQAR